MIKTAILALWIVAVVASLLGFIIYIIVALIPEKKVVKKNYIKRFSIKEIEGFIQDSTTAEETLEKVIKSLAEHHKLPPKDGGNPSKKAKALLDMIFTLSGHTNIDKDMRDRMFRELRLANPDYVQEFSGGR